MSDKPESSSDSFIFLDAVDLTLGSDASRVHVLDSVSLSVPQGLSVGIVGPSGSGKSTLLMVMAGLERIDSGTDLALTADRVGTAEIMRRTGLSKPSVWRWQDRYLEAGVDGAARQDAAVAHSVA